MTRKEIWEEFENQLKKEVHTPVTMSYDDSIRLAELGIEETVARWKPRLEQGTCGDCISREKTLEKFYDYIKSDMSMNDFDALYDIVAKMPSVQPKTVQAPCEDCISRAIQG